MTPDEHTNQELHLDVGDGHTIYVQDWGIAKAKTPIFFLHGGPGNGTGDKYKLRFDPKINRVIFHDQRGSGQSTPYGSLKNNTTDKLVGDITKIADKLKIKKFAVAGGSWGSTLALAYALKHPDRVSDLLIQGIFTGSKSEIEWIDHGFFRLFYPEVWEEYLQTVPKSHRKNPTEYHAKYILGSPGPKQIASAMAYQKLESSVLVLDDRPTIPADPETYDSNFITIETHYLQNGCFMPDRYILDNAHKLTMPTWIVQGRYDMVCAPAVAYELHQRIKGSKLIWTMAGHGNDRSTYDVLRTLYLQFN